MLTLSGTASEVNAILAKLIASQPAAAAAVKSLTLGPGSLPVQVELNDGVKLALTIKIDADGHG